MILFGNACNKLHIMIFCCRGVYVRNKRQIRGEKTMSIQNKFLY